MRRSFELSQDGKEGEGGGEEVSGMGLCASLLLSFASSLL